MDTQTHELVRRRSLRGQSVINVDALTLSDAQAPSQQRSSSTLDRNCVICHAAIETERVRAMPDVDRCSGCSHR